VSYLNFSISIAKLSLLLCCFWLLTGPQLILQLGAWSWMITSYSQETSFEQAVKETFGGDRPCELCKLIQNVETSEQETIPGSESSETKSLKLLLGQAKRITFADTYVSSAYQNISQRTALHLYQKVPTPPPRLANLA
jgi:hypothetical protein